MALQHANYDPAVKYGADHQEADFAVSQGRMIIGDASGMGAELDISGDGQIIVGNGTTATSVSVSGDATLSNAGALTVTNTTGATGTTPLEVVTATNTITAAESGTVFVLSSATEFESTLPTAAAGLRYRFIVGAAPSGASYTVVTPASASIIQGVLVVNGASVAGVNEDIITFVDGLASVGDWVELISDGTSWFISGVGSAAGSITLTQAA